MSRAPIPKDVWIARQAALQKFLDATRQAPWLALDTEFIRTRTYYPVLCLIQVSDGQRHALIDTLAGLDLTPLAERLNRPACVNVLHACLQDMEIVHHYFGLIPRNVFDTQIAWGLLGNHFQISYAGIVQEHLDLTIDKSQSRSRWDLRPLTKAQLQYALSDVTHLGSLYLRLTEELEKEGKLSWLEEEMRRLLVPETWIPDPDEIWRRIRTPERNSLSKNLNILQALSRWRELTARRLNQARPRVVKDDVLVELTLRPPRTRTSFDRQINDHVVHSVRDELWQTLQQAKEQPLPKHISYNRAERMEQQAHMRRLMPLTREIAHDLRVAPELLAPRSMLLELIQRKPNPTLLQGWRRECAGRILQNALHGA